MRAIFFSLVVINVCLLAWGSLGGVGGPGGASVKVGASVLPSGVASLKLLSDIERQADGDLKDRNNRVSETALEPVNEVKGEPVVSTEVRAAPQEKPLCEMVGVFRTKEEAAHFVERLVAIDVKSDVKELELPAGPGYWVYLKPESSRREALKALGGLQSKGVDSYVIPKGELANGISLGMFSQKKLADARVLEVRALGLTPQVQEIERTYRELWVMLSPGEHRKMSEITWSRLLENFEKIERRQNFCVLAVASDENFL